MEQDTRAEGPQQSNSRLDIRVAFLVSPRLAGLFVNMSLGSWRAPLWDEEEQPPPPPLAPAPASSILLG
ncbi:Protein of unknown function [Cotesia congregata]|uniref:Uncharacterized protein n=1 Tax=Cotesia congregata TaxID=51543 RepID=A0A8J2HFN2_COTCN|nr:Protein of unknown function [Cotesia congregata]